MLREQLGQMALEDGHAAAAEGLHPRFVIVNAGDLVSYFGKADGRNESHISGPITQMETGFDMRLGYSHQGG